LTVASLAMMTQSRPEMGADAGDQSRGRQRILIDTKTQAKADSSKKSVPLSSKPRMRARGSNLPRSVWRLRADRRLPKTNLR